MRLGPPRNRRGRSEQKGAPESDEPGGPDIESALRRHTSPPLGGARRAADEAFRAVLAEANRDLAGLLRDVREWRTSPQTGAATPGRPVANLLKRAVRCAVQQYTLQAEMGVLALTDGLTGLCNRRGFLALAERQLRLGRRTGRPMLLFFVDVDGLKTINDSFGHREGDRALMRTAEAMKRTFRASDIVARFGGDEFAALAIEAAGYGEAAITDRLREALKAATPRDCRYALSVSVGAARFDPGNSASIGHLMILADQAMYARKTRTSKRPRGQGQEESAGGPGPT